MKKYRLSSALLFGSLFLGGALLAGCSGQESSDKSVTGEAVKKTAAAGGEASSCVSCHTDAERLKVESAMLPKPKKSALTSGKG